MVPDVSMTKNTQHMTVILVTTPDVSMTNVTSGGVPKPEEEGDTQTH